MTITKAVIQAIESRLLLILAMQDAERRNDLAFARRIRRVLKASKER